MNRYDLAQLRRIIKSTNEQTPPAPCEGCPRVTGCPHVDAAYARGYALGGYHMWRYLPRPPERDQEWGQIQCRGPRVAPDVDYGPRLLAFAILCFAVAVPFAVALILELAR